MTNPFQQSYKMTFEQKVNSEAMKQWDAVKAAAHDFDGSMTQKRLNQLNNDIHSAKTAVTPKPAAPKGFQSGKRFVEYNKIYKNGIYTFKVWNPADLSKKQQQVIHSFIIGLTDRLPVAGLSFETVAPWIDVVFMFNRGEMTEATFHQITALHIQTSTFDSRNDHNR